MRHRVADYRAGDLESAAIRSLPSGRTPSSTTASCRAAAPPDAPTRAALIWTRFKWKQAHEVLSSCASAAWCIRGRGCAVRAHGKTVNRFGTLQCQYAAARRHALPRVLRVAGVLAASASCARGDAAVPTCIAAHDALVDVIVLRCYAPLPLPARPVAQPLGVGVPQWTANAPRLARARRGAVPERVDGIDWYWPAGENLRAERERGATLSACSRPSTRWCGTAAASSTSGAGLSLRGLHAAPQRVRGYATAALWRNAVISQANATSNGRRPPRCGTSGSPAARRARRSSASWRRRSSANGSFPIWG